MTRRERVFDLSSLGVADQHERNGRVLKAGRREEIFVPAFQIQQDSYGSGRLGVIRFIVEVAGSALDKRDCAGQRAERQGSAGQTVVAGRS